MGTPEQLADIAAAIYRNFGLKISSCLQASVADLFNGLTAVRPALR